MSYYVKITQENEETINLIETQVLERTSGINVAYHAELSPPLNSNPASRLVDGNLTTIARSENPTIISFGGEEDWTQQTIEIPSNSNHVFRWEYVKDKNTIEQFTIGFSKNIEGVELYLMWDTTVISIPLN